MLSPAPESRNTVTVLVVYLVSLVVVTAIGSAIVIVLSKRRSRAKAKSIQMYIMSRYYTCCTTEALEIKASQAVYEH